LAQYNEMKIDRFLIDTGRPVCLTAEYNSALERALWKGRFNPILYVEDNPGVRTVANLARAVVD
jgi:hypothetical protein